MRFAMAVGVVSLILASTAQARAETALMSPRQAVVADSASNPAGSGLTAVTTSGTGAKIAVPSNPFAKYLTFLPGLALQLLKAAPAHGPKSPSSLFRAFPLVPRKLQSSGGTLLTIPPLLDLSGSLQPSLRLRGEQNADLRHDAINILNHRVFGPLNEPFLNNPDPGSSEFSSVVPVLDAPMSTGRWDLRPLGWQKPF